MKLSATALKWFHLARVLLWIVLVAAVMGPLKGLQGSISFLVFLSLVAPLLSDFSSWQASRAEEAADDAETIAEAVLRRLEERGVIE